MSRIMTMHRGLPRVTASGLMIVFCLAMGINLVPGDAANDVRIKDQLLAKLTGLVSIHPERLEVTVSEAVVRITGSVASVGEKLVIGRIAGSIMGVASIANDLSVRAVDRPEADILQDVTRLLQNRPKFRDVPIRVLVSGNEVTLDGQVKHNADKAEAEEIAGTVAGVTRVVNTLEVDSAGTIPDEIIKSKVESALANPITFGAVRNLEVTVEEGTVTLKGTVRRDMERRQAERIVVGVEGVGSVLNLITIEES